MHADRITYRHPCGRIDHLWPDGALTRSIDPRYATGKCLCGGKEPWQADPPPNGHDLKADGQAAAASAALAWTVAARRWIESRPAGSVYTSEDLTADLGQPPSSGAVGSVMTWGGRRRLHHKSGRTQAQRRNQHAAELTVWVRS